MIDEVTSGLDIESRREVWSLIKKIKNNRTIIISTQHLEEADEIADKICILKQGSIKYLDTPFNFKK